MPNLDHGLDASETGEHIYAIYDPETDSYAVVDESRNSYWSDDPTYQELACFYVLDGSFVDEEDDSVSFMWDTADFFEELSTRAEKFMMIPITFSAAAKQRFKSHPEHGYSWARFHEAYAAKWVGLD